MDKRHRISCRRYVLKGDIPSEVISQLSSAPYSLSSYNVISDQIDSIIDVYMYGLHKIVFVIYAPILAVSCICVVLIRDEGMAETDAKPLPSPLLLGQQGQQETQSKSKSKSKLRCVEENRMWRGDSAGGRIFARPKVIYPHKASQRLFRCLVSSRTAGLKIVLLGDCSASLIKGYRRTQHSMCYICLANLCSKSEVYICIIV